METAVLESFGLCRTKCRFALWLSSVVVRGRSLLQICQGRFSVCDASGLDQLVRDLELAVSVNAPHDHHQATVWASKRMAVEATTNHSLALTMHSGQASEAGSREGNFHGATFFHLFRN